MLRWFFYNIFNTLCAIICYITNPFVVLFCDRDGELHGFLNYWQTWDDSCNPKCAIENAPKWIRYDWDKHYKEYQGTTPELAAVGRKRWFAKCIDPNFTFIERIKRYLCRVYWLTRNCAYGFSFWLFGLKIDPSGIVTIKTKQDDIGRMDFIRDMSSNILIAPFKYKNNCRITKLLRWEIFIGWKINEDAEMPTQAMIANRITIRFGNY